MPVVVVGAEKNLADVLKRVFTGRMSAAERKRIGTALEGANPGVDFATLSRGMVLSIPDLFGVRSRAREEDDLSLDDLSKSAMEEVQRGVEAAIKEFVASAAREETEASQERRSLAKTIESEVFQGEVSTDQALAADFEEVRRAIDEEEARSEQRLAALHRAAAEWSNQLDILKAVLP